jgi:hypothetical protein
VPIDQRVPLLRQPLQFRGVRVAPRLDRPARPLEPRLPLFRRRPAGPYLAHLVELLVEREHLFEQRRRHLLGALAVAAGRHPFDGQQIVDARHRLAQRPIGVVQVRRPFETGPPFSRSRVVEVVRVELPTQGAEILFELHCVDSELTRHPEVREVVAVPAERQDLGALRAEVDVQRCATAAAAADLKRMRGFGTHRRA